MAGRTVIGYQVIICVWVVGRIRGGAVGRRERSKEASKEKREGKIQLQDGKLEFESKCKVEINTVSFSYSIEPCISERRLNGGN
jgi:hypothetical protein